MTKFLILHGTDSSPSDNWFMWLKGKLVGEGNKVWLPQLPDSQTPNAKIYNKFLLSNKDFTIDSDTIVIGHSSGAVEILSLLDNLPKKTVIKAAILVSAFKDNLQWDTLDGLFEQPFDFENIKDHSKRFIFIHSDNDPYIPLSQAEFLCNELDGELGVIEGQGHFNIETSPDYKQFPELLDIIESI
ncbi:MAG: RBBP9/YdeN family alpha/beta hydrolase [Candidatus Saccharimonadaceae bacterium]